MPPDDNREVRVIGRLGGSRYELLRPMAEGGMAELWLAKLTGSAGFAKLVAVKRILPHLARSRRFADMFLDEGRIAADLRHPNIVQVLEAGSDDGELFISMELLEGMDCGRLISRTLARGERVPIGAAVQIVADAAAGLAYAHKKTSLDGEPLEIVHRDVSPQNLFVTVDGHTKVVDFGIAKARSQTTMTEAGTLKGKCAYMAPEQVCGDPVDHRADQFALGVVLWELITGQRLFRRDNDVETLRSVLKHEIKAPSTVVDGVPPVLESIVMRALSLVPEQRYPTCDELGAALDDAFDHLRTDDGRLAKRGPRAVAAVVGARLSDPLQQQEPASSQERTLPQRLFVEASTPGPAPGSSAWASGEDITSADREPIELFEPPKLAAAAPAVGRDDEQAALRRALDGAVGPVTLVGPAGVGKSHLARAFLDAEHAAGRAPGGTYFVECSGAESAGDLVTLFAFALGIAPDALLSRAPPAPMPADLQEAAAAAGRALSARGRALVCLDGVDEIGRLAGQLGRALSAHAGVLATARAPLEAMGERIVDVGPLPLPHPSATPSEILQAPAVQLLLIAAGNAAALDPDRTPTSPSREPTERLHGDALARARAAPAQATGTAPFGREDAHDVAEVARSTGGLPSALLLAGRWLGERRAKPVADELSRRSGERSLAALLESGVQQLNDDDRSALLRLAPHRGPLDEFLVDILVPERAPREVLECLRRGNVLVGDRLVPAACDRSLDELAARGTLAEARANHARAVAARVAVELLKLEGGGPAAPQPATASVALAVDPNGATRTIKDDAPAAAAAPPAEQDTKQAARVAANAFGVLERLRPCVEDALEALLRQSERPRAVDGAGAGAALADAVDDAAHEDDARVLQLALALDAVVSRRGASPAHVRLLDEALRRAGAGVDRHLRARALEARADHQKLGGKAGDARRDYQLALQLVSSSPSPADGDALAARAILHRNLADLDLDAGDLVGAERHARDAIGAARKATSSRVQQRVLARATWTLARVALRRGDVAEAELLLETCAEAFKKHADMRFAARAAFELGRCAEARGDARAARALFREALIGHEEQHDPAFAERARLHLGVVAAWGGDFDEARAFLEAARDAALARGDHRAEAAAMRHLADVDAAARGQPRSGAATGASA